MTSENQPLESSDLEEVRMGLSLKAFQEHDPIELDKIYTKIQDTEEAIQDLKDGLQ